MRVVRDRLWWIEFAAWVVAALAIITVLLAWLVFEQTSGPIGYIALAVAVIAVIAGGGLRARERTLKRRS